MWTEQRQINEKKNHTHCKQNKLKIASERHIDTQTHTSTKCNKVISSSSHTTHCCRREKEIEVRQREGKTRARFVYIFTRGEQILEMLLEYLIYWCTRNSYIYALISLSLCLSRQLYDSRCKQHTIEITIPCVLKHNIQLKYRNKFEWGKKRCKNISNLQAHNWNVREETTTTNVSRRLCPFLFLSQMGKWEKKWDREWNRIICALKI